MDILNLELRKLGFKEKEAGVYLAALELGFSSVQKIAQMAEISRPTAYEIIKSLIKRGLMKEVKRKGLIRGEKSYFTAESPDTLLGLLRVQKKEIEEKEREFIRIISILQSKYYLAGQSEIRTYEGKEQFKVLLDDFSQSQTEEIFLASDSPETLKPWQEKLPQIQKRLSEVKVKEIKLKNFSGTLILYDKLIFVPHSEKLRALLIINAEIVQLIKSLL